MTATAPAARPRPAARRPAAAPRAGRLQPLRAVRAYRRLLADKEDTVAVFEIMRALNGRSTARGYERLLRTADGGRIACAQADLAERLSDRTYVEAFAPGTVGAAYADFTRRENLSPEGLIAVSRQVYGPSPDADHPYAWFGRRIRDTHDLWHILTGYGRDGVGEACLVAFSFAQTGGLGWGFIAAGAAHQGLKAPGPHPYARAVLEGWRRGRRSAWLPGEDYEALLAEPLADARRRLNITQPHLYHAIPPEARNRQAAMAA